MRRKIIAVVVLLLIAGVFLLRFGSPTFPPPLLLPMGNAASNTAFSVCPGTGGAMFIMPDGSLWRWGTTGVSTTNATNSLTPELLDNQHHWAGAFTKAGQQWLALETNGNVWKWDGRPARGANQLIRVSLPGANEGWVDLTGGVAYGLGLQRDGTILGWEDTTTQPLAPVETNFLWRAVVANGPPCMGVARDGELYTWQRTGFSPLVFSPPVQASSKSNWTGLTYEGFAWSSSGELWGASVDRLYSSNAIPGRFALGSIVYEIRSDGALWAAGEPGELTFNRRLAGGGARLGFSGNQNISGGKSPAQNSGSAQWRQIGKRNDWVSVWGSEETYYGLTSDGTVWVWGVDWGMKPFETMQNRISRLWQEIGDRFRRPAGGGTTGTGGTPGVVIVSGGRGTRGGAGAQSGVITSVGGGTLVVTGRLGVVLTQPQHDEPRPLIRFNPNGK